MVTNTFVVYKEINDSKQKAKDKNSVIISQKKEKFGEDQLHKTQNQCASALINDSK